MQRSSRPRSTASLSNSVHHQLNMYALAASAAGVGMLALAQPAEAKIVYTPTHETIGPHHPTIQLDFAHDHNVEFNLSHGSSCQTTGGRPAYSCFVDLSMRGRGSNAAMARVSGRLFDSALKQGARIGPGGAFHTGWGGLVGIFSFGGVTSVSGPWDNVKNRYLGVQIDLGGKTHYGWARLNVKVGRMAIKGTLTGYAYETIPNKPIIAGKTKGADVITVQPASLGHLAAGASAIPAWRTGK